MTDEKDERIVGAAGRGLRLCLSDYEDMAADRDEWKRRALAAEGALPFTQDLYARNMTEALQALAAWQEAYQEAGDRAAAAYAGLIGMAEAIRGRYLKYLPSWRCGDCGAFWPSSVDWCPCAEEWMS